MSDRKQDAVKRRDTRATKSEETTPGKGRKKDTKRWCLGKPGREHVGVCMRASPFVIRGRDIRAEDRQLCCSVCGRVLATYYGGSWFGLRGPNPKPWWYL